MTSPDIIDMKAKVTNDFARAWRLHKAYFEQEHSRAANKRRCSSRDAEGRVGVH